MSDLLKMLGRSRPLFERDVAAHEDRLRELVGGSRILVVGGAGSIGQAVVQELFVRSPARLHVVDISENNLVELVRDIRSSLGYIEGEFKTFAIDFTAVEFQALLESTGGYDYVFNLSALKHVRSERDEFTLMRMLDVNALATDRLLAWCNQRGVKRLFCVSTDKATNPANMMGCSKRIMELMLFAGSGSTTVSTARFANVAFSDGSLLHGFNQRIAKQQPLSAPSDVRRYFITRRESGLLCMSACLLGTTRETFFPKVESDLSLITFSEIADRYLQSLGYEPVRCSSEDEARAKVEMLRRRRQWPVFYFDSDTSGEKPFEEFFAPTSDVDLNRFEDIGVIRNPMPRNLDGLHAFRAQINRLKAGREWSKSQLVALFQSLVPEF
jgi:FlaA1/EpsC-like NDP-sugar epimerase